MISPLHEAASIAEEARSPHERSEMRELTWGLLATARSCARRARRRRPRSGELATGGVGYGLRDFGGEMSQGNVPGYLPGDPRYGLSGEALRNYYRTKPAQWAIYCWDKPGTEATRRALLQNQKSYVKNFGERVIGYGHFVSDDGRDTLGTSFFMQLDDRAAADAFVAGEPMSKAGVYQRVEIHRWSNSFQKRQADYRRKGLQQFLCTGPKTGTPEFFREHLHAHESHFASYGDSFIFPDPIRSADGADNIGTALLLELPDRGGGQVLERGAVCQERRISERSPHRPL